MENTTFRAPWGTSLKVITGLVLLILIVIPVIGIVIPVIGMVTGPQYNAGWILSMIVLPFLILLIAVFFVIRGYVLTKDTLLIRRLGWNSQVDLSDLSGAEIDPEAMTGIPTAFLTASAAQTLWARDIPMGLTSWMVVWWLPPDMWMVATPRISSRLDSSMVSSIV